MSGTLRYRQVHLDFHTSEHIVGIGEAFDAERFASTLERAHVNSVTCFARCHHGWMYYDTERFPERRHPHLKRNLLEEQIETCHRHGIRVPIYVTVQWDHYTASLHPEWLALDENGRIRGTPPFEPGFYRALCVNSPYLDFLKAHVAELFEKVPVDGLFFDIVQPLDDASMWTRRAMEAEGLRPDDANARQAFGRRVIDEFKTEMTAFVRRFSADCTVFYNSGHIGPRQRAAVSSYTHFEIESLPSGHWGYEHFPLSARYARTLGLPVLGMTGKFHTAWGDFHSYKNKAALEYECFRMLALGATCSIGDQLEPDGELDDTTYGLIGSVYEQVAQKEAWCEGTTPLAEIGVFTPEEFTGERIPAAASGANKILQEGGRQFDFIDSASDLAPYQVVILPDSIPVSPTLAEKLGAFVAAGGAIIASHTSGMNEEAKTFASNVLGVTPVGPAPYSPDFIRPRAVLGAELPHAEHVMYLRALEVKALPGTEILADTIAPYFNRTFEHFSSHRHTPSSGQRVYPAVVRSGRAIYFAHPVFTQYETNAPHWCKQLMLSALNILSPQPLLRHNGPSTLLATVGKQGEHRVVIHLLNYIPTRRGREMDIIEDIIPLHNLSIRLRLPEPVTDVMLVPENVSLAFTYTPDSLSFTVPVVGGHQMICVNTG